MDLVSRYRLRLERQRRLWRAFRKRRDLAPVALRTGQIRPGDVIVATTLRNERVRLPYFLDYYRKLGVAAFLMVDNGSDDGSREYLADMPDVSLWTTQGSYRKAAFGMDWLHHLLRRYAHDHWVLTVDPDEFLVYPFCDTRPLPALTEWLDAMRARAFPAMLLDMYPRGEIDAAIYREGADPFETAVWFDPGNYTIKPNGWMGNLWIQGGPRARAFFANAPEMAPSLNKIPLVRWHRSYAYASSTHMLLPRGLNRVWDQWGGERVSGCLLHAKFLSVLRAKVSEELQRRQHFADSREYRAYAKGLGGSDGFWCAWSERYAGWRQLEVLGLMSRGDWA